MTPTGAIPDRSPKPQHRQDVGITPTNFPCNICAFEFQCIYSLIQYIIKF